MWRFNAGFGIVAAPISYTVNGKQYISRSPIALSVDALYAVVHEGALMKRGMPRYEMLTREQITQIHAYIRTGARDVLVKLRDANASASKPGNTQ